MRGLCVPVECGTWVRMPSRTLPGGESGLGQFTDTRLPPLVCNMIGVPSQFLSLKAALQSEIHQNFLVFQRPL